MVVSAVIYANNAKKTRCIESQQDVNNDEKIDKGMSSLDIAGAMIKHSKEVLSKFSDGSNMKKDNPKIMWSLSPLKNNRTKTMKQRNSPSKKANFKIPGLTTYKKQPTQILMKKAISKTKSQNTKSVEIKQELIDSITVPTKEANTGKIPKPEYNKEEKKARETKQNNKTNNSKNDNDQKEDRNNNIQRETDM